MTPNTESRHHRSHRDASATATSVTAPVPRDTPVVLPTVVVRAAPPPEPPCLRAPVQVRRVNGHATWTGSLTDCDGHPTLHGLAAISVLASPLHLDTLPDLEPVVAEIRRIAPAAGWVLADEHPHRRARAACPPGEEPVATTDAAAASGAPDDPTRSAHDRPHRNTRPTCRAIEVSHDAHTTDPMLELDHRVRVVHPRLLSMLDEVTRHFPGHRVEVISGYRPSNNPQAGSRHAHARALDYRLEGIAREALRDFAYTLPLAGVGYYPNSVFVHMDVRDSHEGSARWTDYSSHGETPRYGHWPPRDEDVVRETDFLVNQAGHALDALRAQENSSAAPSGGRHDDSGEDGDDADEQESTPARPATPRDSPTTANDDPRADAAP